MEKQIDEEALKQKVQKYIVTISCLILIGKFIAYYITQSVGVLTDALESIVNVVAGFISLGSLRWSALPKDEHHPFGHGKIELISASIEGILISIAGAMIIYEGIMRLFSPVEVMHLDIGIYIVAFSGLLNYLMGWYSIRIGKRYNSMALIAGGKHLQSDTYSTIGLVAGLVVLYLTQIVWIDSLLALLFGGLIAGTGISILRKTIANLLDAADEQLLNDLVQTLNEKRPPEWIDIHNTRIIKSGSYLYIDCDLTIPWYYTIEEGHREAAKLQNLLRDKYANKVQLTIHLDPCNIFDKLKCNTCALQQCKYRREVFTEQETISLTSFTGAGGEV